VLSRKKKGGIKPPRRREVLMLVAITVATLLQKACPQSYGKRSRQLSDSTPGVEITPGGVRKEAYSWGPPNTRSTK